jgi:phenylacetate-coenzyme A ligase PaaK-like adenylate-forming protein
VELISPETDEVITTTGRIGRVLATHFLRVAAPALRLETGDLGMWHDPPATPHPRLSLHGRRFPFSLDIGGIALCEEEVWSLVRLLEQEFSLLKLQLVLGGPAQAPQLTVRLSLRGTVEPALLEARVQQAAQQTLPALWQAMSQGQLPKIAVHAVPLSNNEQASRRKSRLIADLRKEGSLS